MTIAYARIRQIFQSSSWHHTTLNKTRDRVASRRAVGHKARHARH
jgi:hypothetical protein